MDEVRQHQTEGQMWTVLKGRVYNISPYMKFHPGGIAISAQSASSYITFLILITGFTKIIYAFPVTQKIKK